LPIPESKSKLHKEYSDYPISAEKQSI
jgi:hypothetical protein